MNFLSDLVARNLGAAAAIRPRLTSRFEPARSNLVVGHDPAVEQSVATALEETEAETMITPHEAQMNECGIHPEPRRSKPRTIIPALDDSAGNSAEQETSASPHGASQDAKRTAPLLRSRQRPATNPVGSRAASPRSPWSSSHTESSAGDRNEPEQEPDAILESPRTVWARSNLL